MPEALPAKDAVSTECTGATADRCCRLHFSRGSAGTAQRPRNSPRLSRTLHPALLRGTVSLPAVLYFCLQDCISRRYYTPQRWYTNRAPWHLHLLNGSLSSQCLIHSLPRPLTRCLAHSLAASPTHSLLQQALRPLPVTLSKSAEESQVGQSALAVLCTT